MEYHPDPPPLSTTTALDSTDLFDWDNLFNFAINPDDITTDHLLLPWSAAAAGDDLPGSSEPVAEQPPIDASVHDDSSRVRKRDPRLICPNYLAGIVPCACPELDALAEKEEAAEIAIVPKKRVKKSGTAAQAQIKCQVPGCEADIRELKGYHRRHRVCLSCANSSCVFLDGEQKRYCQQCGKFHLLPDFDEGKRSCRRKLERHNKRRRRKPDSKNNVETDNDQVDLLTNLTAETSNVEAVLSNKSLEKENSTGSDERNDSPSCTPIPINMQNEPSNNSIVSTEEAKLDNNNNNNNNNNNRNSNENPFNSSLFYENKTAYSSSCPTGRISFKLYDWNPAEFPRRLRHQIFEWLSSMPVELEGYIRPGCTILTLFISMPHFMWDKLYKDAASLIKDLVNSPNSLLYGKGNFLIYLDNKIIQIINDGTSSMNIKMEVHAPKIHYVHPNFFEAGKPIEFIICGSFLHQPKFRSLVSFNGEYVKHECNHVIEYNIGNGEDGRNGDDHEMLRISISHTEPGVHGPAFIEVDNVSGLSNFVPVLFGTRNLCTELNKIQEEALNSNQYKNREFFKSKQNILSELLLDIAWLQSKPNNITPYENNNKLSTANVERLTRLMKYLISNNLFNILEIVLSSLENLRCEVLSNLEKGKHDFEIARFVDLVNHSKTLLHSKTPTPLLTQGKEEEEEKEEENRCSTSGMYGEEETVTLVGRQFRRTWSVAYPGGPTRARFAAAVMVGVLVCVTACIVLFHPREPSLINRSVRRYLYRGS